MQMRTIERILMKVVIIQFLFLVVTQIFFHKLNVFPELKELSQYEGVSKDNFTQLLETFNGR